MSDDTNNTGIGAVGLIVAIAGYYFGLEQGYYWLWKTCQILLIIYGIIAGVVIILILALLIGLAYKGLKSLFNGY